MRRVTVLLVAALGLGAAGCGPAKPDPKTSRGDGRPAAPKPADLYNVRSMDDLQRSLADRAGKAFNPDAAPDFQVIVTQAAYPIGTLIRRGSTVPEDYSACAPVAAAPGSPAPDVSPPPAAPTPNLFPTYAMTSEMAAEIGLDDTVFRGLMSAGAKIDRKRAVTLAFERPRVAVLSQADIRRLALRPGCAAAVGIEPVWLVRGYVNGRRKFTLGGSLSTAVSAKLAKIGDFKVTPYAGDGSIDLADGEDTGFLEVISEIAPQKPVVTTVAITPPTAAPPPPPPPAPHEVMVDGHKLMVVTPQALQLAKPPQTSFAMVRRVAGFTVSKPQATTAQGLVYIQRDRADSPDAAARVAAALKTGFAVASTVEAVDSARMPKLPEVRYFRDADAEAAARLLSDFKAFYPAAVAKRVALPAPPGQMEVWLPRIG